MKYRAAFLYMFMLMTSVRCCAIEQKKFAVIICSYNNQEWVEKNLRSLFSQKYSNYRVIYVDDCSTDGTVARVETLVASLQQQHRFLLITNKSRQKKLANMYQAIQLCADDEIVVEYDGDDWFAHTDVLSQLNYLYTTRNIWLTYGRHRSWPNRDQSWGRPIAGEIIKRNLFRRMPPGVFGQVRTFYAWLFKCIKKEDLQDQNSGNFYPTNADIAIMLPLIEMAGERFAFIRRPMYVYNVGTQSNDFHLHAQEQIKFSEIIRSRPAYQRLAARPTGESVRSVSNHEQAPRITASMATMASRKKILPQVVSSILPQVDRLNVYLNGYSEVPSCLQHPKIVTVFSSQMGDQGDRGKFFWADSVSGYHLTIDDDIVYPPDYVATLIERIEKYHRRAVVGVHGILLQNRVRNYYRNRRCLFFNRSLSRDTPVHLLGTGTIAYHTDTIKVQSKDFLVPNMADIWFGILAQQQRIPLVTITHRGNWLVDLSPPGTTIFERYVKDCRVQTNAINSIRQWQIYPVAQ